MSGKPPWRQAYDEMERRIGPVVTEVAHNAEVLQGMAKGGALVDGVRSRVESAARAGWHLLNLPARSDVVRLSQQVGALDRQVRRLSLQLEQEQDARRLAEARAAAATQRAATAPDPAPAKARPTRAQAPDRASKKAAPKAAAEASRSAKSVAAKRKPIRGS